MQNFLSQINFENFIIFDIETTGFSKSSDKIIEIAAIKVENSQVSQRFNELINPEQIIPENITKLTGITNEMVENAGTISEVLPIFTNFIKDFPLLAHNIKFDWEFIKHKCLDEDLDLEQNEILVDTLILSQIFLPEGPVNHKLETLKDYLKIDIKNSHRALADCETTLGLFQEIIKKIEMVSFDDIRKLTAVATQSRNYAKDFLIKVSNSFTNKIFSSEGKKRRLKLPGFNSIESASKISEDKKAELLQPEVIDLIFGREGLLKHKVSSFEYREQQFLMAESTLKAFLQNRFLLCEAGTGVGKSFAYLIPSIINYLVSEEKVIVSTNTKNLQEQIFFKDIPMLHELFSESFTAIILKGRGNYLCLKKFYRMLSNPDENLDDQQIEKFLPLVIWGLATETGDIEENSGFKRAYGYDVWVKLHSDSASCNGRKCPYYKKCFLQNIRKKVHKAGLVVINHSLLFSDASSENAVLGKYDHLVLDEAHNLESTATKYLGVEFSFNLVKTNLYRLQSYDTKRGLLNKVIKKITQTNQAGVNVDRFLERSDNLKSRLPEFLKNSQDIFDSIGHTIYKDNNQYNEQLLKNRFRDFEKELISGQSLKELKIFKDVFEDIIEESGRLTKLLSGTEELEDLFEDEILEFKSITDELEQTFSNFNFFLNSKRENYVYWYEILKKDTNYFFKLAAAPLEISQILDDLLYSKLKSAIFTSATISIENRFKYYINKSGLAKYKDSKLDTLSLGSPYSEHQLKVIVPSYIASPKMQSLFTNDIEEFLQKVILHFDRGSLALFTSYKQMSELFYRVNDLFKEHDRLISMQSKEGSRRELLNQFKAVRNSVLFGTNSFWEGVDVPGASLEMVVIARLPFAVPSEPIIQARLEKLEKEGKNSFMHYSVPEAILKFKQGIGRLLRSHSDQGVVYILDSRVVNTRWGSAFINSLPVKPNIAKKLSEVITETEKFF